MHEIDLKVVNNTTLVTSEKDDKAVLRPQTSNSSFILACSANCMVKIM